MEEYEYKLYICNKVNISFNMKTIDTNHTIIDGYVKLLNNLSLSNKLDLIAKLSLSIQAEANNKKNRFIKAFGAFESKKNADEIIDEIRSSRLFNRQIEEI